ncbi:protein of unknown function [Candidatus Nitrospira inopinata]|uniref:Uncharacterized protein n=1 Tax=Candidatus Nitrospira inopinata TaxID=1715989 RepID=A0A0S4KNU6_9BACT|nr:protein of unknown function [Candidatus Nitrospira inopinata]
MQGQEFLISATSVGIEKIEHD